MKRNQLTHCLQNFYRLAYQDDEMAYTINENATFAGLLENITDPYAYIFGDSGHIDPIIRERLFEELADIMEVEYNEIYRLWLAN